MIKLSRPVLWLAIVFAAGIMLVPQRGAAGTIPCRYYEPPPPLLGDPDDPGIRLAFRLPTIELMPGTWWSFKMTTYVASKVAGVRDAKAAPKRGQ
jgi:hypothetical protein